MFTLAGIVPSYLPSRVKSIHEAGVWRRWTQLAVESSANEDSWSTISAAKMNGNVGVIFIV